MIEVGEAKRILAAEAGPLDPIEVPAAEALGRVLAEELRADRDMPAAHLSTMDGFAVRSADVPAPGALLQVSGEVRAGEAPRRSVGPGEAIRIFTGALLPPGADAVVMVERTRVMEGGGRVEILTAVPAGQHVRRRGEEARAGAALAPAGTLVRAPEIALLASLGKVRAKIHRPPIVHVLSTGDELVEPDAAPLPHQVRDSNHAALLALLRELGVAGTSLGRANDDAAPLDAALRAGLVGDVLLVSGGVSMGAYDLVGSVLADAGMKLLFHQVAVRPGKPLLAGRAGRCLVFGLPGNPVSTFTTFMVFVAPVVRAMMGMRENEPVPRLARLEARLAHKPGRTTYHLARLAVRDGEPVVRAVRAMGSGDVGSLSRANAFVVTEGPERVLEAGERVATLAWGEPAPHDDSAASRW